MYRFKSYWSDTKDGADEDGIMIQMCRRLKYGRHNGLKIENYHFGTNLRLLTEKSTLSTSKYLTYILTGDNEYHGTQLLFVF